MPSPDLVKSGSLTRRQLLHRAATSTGAASLTLWALAGVDRRETSAAPTPADATGGIGDVLETTRKKYDLPALAAAVTLAGRTVAVDAVGYRKYGADTRVTPGDRFHIGSCTKAMTGTLIGMLVEEGKVSWDTPLAQALPDLAGTMRPEYRPVTVEMLLSHRGGLPSRSWPEGKSFLDMHRLPGSPREQRKAYVELFLKEAPEHKPGEKFLYANAGFAIAGAIAERVTDTPWETLMTGRLFRPLGITTAGFGAMGTAGKIDQPWQHRLDRTKHVPVEPGPLSDNPPVIGPGGTVHCSVGDWVKFTAAHAAEGRGNGALLKAETFKRLHTPPFGGDYVGGWGVTERSWGGGRVLTHSGSNTMNFAVTWVAPLKEFAVVIASNQAGGNVEKACDDIAAAMVRRFLLNA
jgi:CubicO group peptidase (beta-lactamase class C family)